jgi:hypothetical protein
MGRSKKIGKPESELLSTLSRILVPENILNDFIISDVKEKEEYWLIEMLEKEERIPTLLLNNKEEIVLDGFCNPILAISHGFGGKPVKLKVFRRRWKVSTENKHFSNDYDLTLKGMRLVPELGIFLKEKD